MLLLTAKFPSETTNALTWSKHKDPTVKTGQHPGSQEKLMAPNPDGQECPSSSHPLSMLLEKQTQASRGQNSMGRWDPREVGQGLTLLH